MSCLIGVLQLTAKPISMQICRIKFVELYRQITDHMASRSTPSYSFILS